MSCIYSEHETAPVAEIRIVGRVTQNDMDHVLPKLEALIRKHGRIRLVEVVESFDSFDPTTILDGIKFDYEHLRDVTHAAVVSDIPWIGFMTRASSMVMPVAIRTFTMDQLNEARAWALDPEGMDESVGEDEEEDATDNMPV